MRTTLFRPEVNVAKGSTWFGQAVLLQPLSFRLLTACIFLSTVVMLLFLHYAQYTKRIPAAGVLIPDLGLIKIQSPNNGIVLERRVREGQQVQAGDVLYVVSSEVMYAPERDSAKNAGTTSSILAKLQARQSIIMADSANTVALAERDRRQARDKVVSLRAEIEQLDQEVETQKERLQAKTSVYERNVQAQAQGFLSPLALQQKYDDLLDQKGRIQSMQRSRLALARDMAAAQTTVDSLSGKNALANSQFERQILDVEQDRVKEESTGKTVITAPQAGIVAVVIAEPGQRVDNQTLLTILPQNSVLEAQVFVPSTAIGFIQEGDPVTVRFASFPFQKFGGLEGKVSQISRTTLTAAEQASDAVRAGAASGADTDARYRVRVKLPTQYLTALGRLHRLHSGMQVDVQFTQERRSLAEWILEPLYKLRDKT